MKILTMWPPTIPSYFNAGHRLTIFSVAEHLRQDSTDDVTALDLAALNATWKTVGDVLVNGDFDVVFIANDFDAVDTFARTVRYIRTLSPRTRIGTFGRLSDLLPEFFHRFHLDFVAGKGDHEMFAADVVAAIAGAIEATDHMWSRDESGTWLPPVPTARYLTVDELPLPDVRQLPYPAYDVMYADDTARFCGIPQRRELIVPVARGCPVGCEFCDVPGREGLNERRISVERVIDYIVRSREYVDFEYVSMYAPTFTLNRKWVHDFCRSYQQLPQRLPWKCTTTIHHMNDELAAAMGAAGCIRISVGLETLEPEAQEHLPYAKHIERERFTRFAESCQRNGIEVNCFVILGLPGTTLAGVKHTREVAESVGARVRPTVYTDFSAMRADMSVDEISTFNRQLLRDDLPEAEALGLYQVLFDPKARPTEVMERIPQRREGHAQV
jgi:anaerobic magnesium-protoporphyrin IX monomethyl ester cyclase